MSLMRVVLGLVLVAGTALSADRKCKVQWDPNGEPVPAIGDTTSPYSIGTYLYLGNWTNQADVYGLRKIDIPYIPTNGVYQVTTNCAISNLVENVVYSSYVTAYSAQGLESENSNTIRWEHLRTQPGKPLSWDMAHLAKASVTLTNHEPPYTMVTNGNTITFTPPPKWQGHALARMVAIETNYADWVGLYSGVRVTNEVGDMVVKDIRIVP